MRKIMLKKAVMAGLIFLIAGITLPAKADTDWHRDRDGRAAQLRRERIERERWEHRNREAQRQREWREHHHYYH